MADKKQKNKSAGFERRGSGFDAPTYGTLLPKGTTFKKNKDGTITPVKPKKK